MMQGVKYIACVSVGVGAAFLLMSEASRFGFGLIQTLAVVIAVCCAGLVVFGVPAWLLQRHVLYQNSFRDIFSALILGTVSVFGIAVGGGYLVTLVWRFIVELAA